MADTNNNALESQPFYRSISRYINKQDINFNYVSLAKFYIIQPYFILRCVYVPKTRMNERQVLEG